MKESRAKERERVFCLLFSAEFQPQDTAEELMSVSAEAEEIEPCEYSDYVRKTFFGAMEFAPEAMRLACEAARGWTAERMSPAMRALLKLSLYEILKTDIAVKIAVNEAVELCKRYEEELGSKFLNGVLGTVSRQCVPEKCTE